MKTLQLLFMIIMLSAHAATAQTSKGTISFGGSIGLSTSRSENAVEDYKDSEFNFSPAVGWFVMDKLMIGANLSTSARKYNNGPGTDVKRRSFGFGPFARYYIFTSNEKFAFTAEAAVGFGGTKEEQDGGGESKSGYVNFRASPGFSFFPTPHWGIELQFSGLTVSANDPNKDGDNDRYIMCNFGLSSLSPSLGVRYYLFK
jgi:hypothetical protein